MVSSGKSFWALEVHNYILERAFAWFWLGQLALSQFWLWFRPCCEQKPTCRRLFIFSHPVLEVGTLMLWTCILATWYEALPQIKLSWFKLIIHTYAQYLEYWGQTGSFCWLYDPIHVNDPSGVSRGGRHEKDQIWTNGRWILNNSSVVRLKHFKEGVITDNVSRWALLDVNEKWQAV